MGVDTSMSAHARGPGRRGRSGARWALIVPFLAVPVVLGCFLLGVAADRRLRGLLEEMRRQGVARSADHAGGAEDGVTGNASGIARGQDGVAATGACATPSELDALVSGLGSAFALEAVEEVRFYEMFQARRATVPELASWLDRLGPALDRLSRDCPADLAAARARFGQPTAALRQRHEPALITEVARRMVLLVQLEALLRRPTAVDRFLSVLHYGVAVGRGNEGELRLRGVQVSDLVLYTTYVQIIDLLKRDVFSADEALRLAAGIEAFDALQVPLPVVVRSECAHQAAVLQQLRARAGVWWWLPRLAFIGDPSAQMVSYGEAVAGALERDPPVKALPEVQHLLRSWETGFSSAAATTLSLPEVATALADGTRCRSLAAACRLVVSALRYRVAAGSFPRSLEDLTRAGLPVPLDPVVGGPYRYVPKGNAFLLYSVDLDGEDGGGDPRKDLVFTSTEHLMGSTGARSTGARSTGARSAGGSTGGSAGGVAPGGREP